MTKTALIASLAEELGVSKKLAAELVNAFIDTVMNGVKKEGEVRIQGFGTFKASKELSKLQRERLEKELILKIHLKKLKSLQWKLLHSKLDLNSKLWLNS